MIPLESGYYVLLRWTVRAQALKRVTDNFSVLGELWDESLCNARVARGGTLTQQQALGETSSIIQSQHKILQN